MMRRVFIMFAAVLFALLTLGCTSLDFSDTTHVASFFAMNTCVTVRPSNETWDGQIVPKDEMDARLTECRELVVEIENLLSTTLPESDTDRFNRSETGITDGSPIFTELMSRALTICDATDGAFTPTLQTLTALWNVTGGGYVPNAEELAEALAHTDPSAVTVEESAVYKTDAKLMVDLGAIGKGYAAQALIEYLRDAGMRAGLVSLGGNVGVFQTDTAAEPFTIGITDPNDPALLLGYVYLTDGYVSVSGDYERYFEADGEIYHHIFDPATGMPADSDLRSVAIISSDGTLADALSTALFVMGEEKALAFYDDGIYDFDAILVTTDGRIIVTAGIADAFERENNEYTLVVHG